jgi:Skp family chaperone for outer membrane proteins
MGFVMKSMKSLAIAAGFALSLAAATPALAQSGAPIAVVDLGRVAEQSAAGKSTQSGIQAVVQQIENELKPEGNAINSEWQSIRATLLSANPSLKQRIDALDKQLANAQQMDRAQAEQAQQVQNDMLRSLNEEAGKNPALRTRLEALGRRIEAQQERQRRIQVELQATAQKANQDLGNAIRAAAQEAMAARGAVIIVDKDQLIANAAAVDITGDVISRLNSRTPSISVTRQRLPQQ